MRDPLPPFALPMCLGIPMEVIAVDGQTARCSAQGIERDVSLFLLPEGSVAVGDSVLVHVGYAIQKMSREEARSTWELYDQALAAERAASDA
jgi:hydrogenase expression/formation protein HypC